MVRGSQEEPVASPAAGDIPRDTEAEAERKREIDRQRKARERERRRAETEQAQNVTVTGRDRDMRDEISVTPPVTIAPPVTFSSESDTSDNILFRLKNAFQSRNPGSEEQREPPREEKVFTIKEAEDAQERLIFLYIQGSKILDDILEIIVKDHEPVKIWELDPDEAAMLVTAQLDQAKKDKEAARIVRIMLRLYSRLIAGMLAWPRLKASEAHVRAHGGFSFK